MARDFKNSSKWRNFAKSGHTVTPTLIGRWVLTTKEFYSFILHFPPLAIIIFTVLATQS